MAKPHKSDSFEVRLWGRVTKTDSCWIWNGSVNVYGYGQIMLAYKNLKVHRVAYELLVGPIPTDMTIDHLCLNKLCVNPEHLEVVTRAENTSRGQKEMFCRNGHDMAVTRYTSPKGKTECRTCRDARAQRAKGDDISRSN